jgi:hypothetical protein
MFICYTTISHVANPRLIVRHHPRTVEPQDDCGVIASFVEASIGDGFCCVAGDSAHPIGVRVGILCWGDRPALIVSLSISSLMPGVERLNIDIKSNH